jgi:hypothetical protein
MEAVIQVLEFTIAARDAYAVGHPAPGKPDTCYIGREMGLSKDRRRDLRMTGSGYPQGLKEAEILLEGRILAWPMCWSQCARTVPTAPPWAWQQPCMNSPRTKRFSKMGLSWKPA